MVAAVGIYFLAYNMSYGYPYFSYTLAAVLFVYMIIIPLLTMRSFTEERHSKTDQMLLTAPVKVTDIVLGKYLAMCTILFLGCLILGLCPLVIRMNGTAFLKNDYAALLAFFLLGCLYTAIGMFISSLTESQIIAAVISFGAMLLLYLWDNLVDLLPTSAGGSLAVLLVVFSLLMLGLDALTQNHRLSILLEGIGVIAMLALFFIKQDLFQNAAANILGKLVFANTFNNFAYYSIFDLSGLVLYLSVAAFFVFLTGQSRSGAGVEEGNENETF